MGFLSPFSVLATLLHDLFKSALYFLNSISNMTLVYFKFCFTWTSCSDSPHQVSIIRYPSLSGVVAYIPTVPIQLVIYLLLYLPFWRRYLISVDFDQLCEYQTVCLNFLTDSWIIYE